MDRGIPTVNKLISTKQNAQNQFILSTHIQKMKSTIDNKPPQKFLASKKKQEQIRLMKQNEIDRENRHLLHKITGIMNHSSSQGALRQTKKSLNSGHRKQELIKIVMENQALLKRIQDQRSKYDSKTWDVERKNIEKYIANISEFPFKDYKPNKTLVQFWNTSQIISDSMLISIDQQKPLGKDLPKKLDPISRNTERDKNLSEHLEEPFAPVNEENDEHSPSNVKQFENPDEPNEDQPLAIDTPLDDEPEIVQKQDTEPVPQSDHKVDSQEQQDKILQDEEKIIDQEDQQQDQEV